MPHVTIVGRLVRIELPRRDVGPLRSNHSADGSTP